MGPQSGNPVDNWDPVGSSTLFFLKNGSEKWGLNPGIWNPVRSPVRSQVRTILKMAVKIKLNRKLKGSMSHFSI